MLILTRRVNESIWIGEHKITVTGIDLRGSVRIGIDAPKDVLILRDELKPKAPTAPTNPSETDL